MQSPPGGLREVLASPPSLLATSTWLREGRGDRVTRGTAMHKQHSSFSKMFSSLLLLSPCLFPFPSLFPKAWFFGYLSPTLLVWPSFSLIVFFSLALLCSLPSFSLPPCPSLSSNIFYVVVNCPFHKSLDTLQEYPKL